VKKPLRVTEITASVSREAGGLLGSVLRISQEAKKNGIEIRVLGTEDGHTIEDTPLWAPVSIEAFPISGPKRFAYSPALGGRLMTLESDIVHLHGLWQFPALAVARWAARTHRPYLVSPHGMLEPWALKYSRAKKAVMSFLFQKNCLRNAKCLLATSKQEAQSIRLAGYQNAIAVVPNGVEVPAVIPERRPVLAQRRRALFLSRVHPKKGLLNLVEAWNRVRPAGWELAIVGPDEGGHLAEVQVAIHTCGLADQVFYDGEVWDDAAKWECYFAAELFVLPTFSENFGLVIAEALGCGVPVITTRGAPWSELESNGCGWWIDATVEALEHALREATNLAPAKLLAMGANGRKLVLDRYPWDVVGRQISDVYRWMAGTIERPEYVIDEKETP